MAFVTYFEFFDALVFFEITVESLQAKFKLNQNKSAEDQDSVIRNLIATGSPHDSDVAELMTPAGSRIKRDD